MATHSEGLNTTNPCVRNCCLDQNDVCLGCFRHLEEIIAWHDMNSGQRIQIQELADARKAVYKGLLQDSILK
ncbi:DUF1289 domain-containing protein [Flocculibacter collagenilyticus]|uniref:DUF1289 domain-containing protein n=1 Tax=Flocculibacter collagenilyticus TaxID=2744479 RepID=UPI0018F32C98|nr:DUF1289 domain-containing protein [Flocculibacter collagenilyticus]